MKSLSLIIPLYNEESRLPMTFQALIDFAGRRLLPLDEVIFVDDGSGDETSRLVKEFKFEFPVKLISYPQNRGKGHAVRKGMLAANSDYALMLDADMSTPLTEIEKFMPFMEFGAPVIIGTRKAVGAEILKRQPLYRQKMGEAYTALANLITGAGVSDFTCGFKCFSKEAINKIFTNAKIDRWSYDAEILYLARLRGFAIQEVPVTWSNDENTKVSLGKDAWQSFRDLLKIRFGKYE